MVKALAFDLVGLDDNKFTLQGCIGHGIFHTSLAAVHRDAQQLLILCDGGHRRIRHDKGGLFRVLVFHSNIAVVHFPAVEHIARAALCRDLNSLALNGGVLVCSAELHADLVQSLEHSLQGHFPFGHRKLKGHVLQLLLRQAVHTGHFPVAELLACGGRVCRCNDGVAPFGCRCGAAIDGKGAAFNGNAVEFLVNGLHLHVRALHGNSRSHVLFVFQLRIALENLPAGKLIARTRIRSNGNFRTLFCRGDICLTIYHFNCMEFCILRVQGNIAFRHLEGDPVLVDPIAQINAGRFPFFKLPAVLVRCQSFDRLPLKSLVCCYVIHLDDNSSIVGFDGVVLLVIRDQSHVIARHGKGGGVHLLLICKRDALSSPAGKLSIFSACSGHGDFFAREGRGHCLTIHGNGGISRSGNRIENFRHNVQVIYRLGRNRPSARIRRRCVRRIAGIVDKIARSYRSFKLNSSNCNSRIRACFRVLKGHRAKTVDVHCSINRCPSTSAGNFHGTSVFDQQIIIYNYT